ncbi:AAA family ATPase [Tumebacillus permanentifrigoris]|uniref:Uncharacterized protein DUF3696 n=1 Tax=Tumebacillus permanentifrigoris TaxID=378543 RepID=A0A316DE49_9BACL|nr:DUF3696 domain-containing protein [Tumebacillus permanentifrigoris]PWK16481.1 uncharacterized protein DUF3696 [Tumebacillus permanentifrigoris]
MIKGFGLENFKAFRDPVFLNFKKINVFVGPNSSGKSSYIKGLLALQETLRTQEATPALHLSERIGDFRSIVYGKKPDGKIKISMEFRGGKGFSQSNERFGNSATDPYIELIAEYLYMFSITHFATKYGTENPAQEINATGPVIPFLNNPVVGVEIVVGEEGPKKPNRVETLVLKFKSLDTCKIARGMNGVGVFFNDKLEISDATNFLAPYKLIFRPNLSNIDNLTITERKKILPAWIGLAMLEKQVGEFIQSIIHLEPFRNEPKRSEMVANFQFGSVGSKGEGVLTNLIGLQETDGEDTQQKTQWRDDINHWLNEFHLAESVDFTELGNNNYSMMIKNKNTGIPSSIVDVGVGTSQLLPIIVESVISPAGSLLLIEEPETHIHPNAQSKLGELFVKCSQKYEKSFIIETHSMYLVRQLQILAAKGELKPEDVGIYYFEQNQDGTHVKDLELMANGQFKEEFPKGFFDVPLSLSRTLMEFM